MGSAYSKLQHKDVKDACAALARCLQAHVTPDQLRLLRQALGDEVAVAGAWGLHGTEILLQAMQSAVVAPPRAVAPQEGLRQEAPGAQAAQSPSAGSQALVQPANLQPR